MGTILGSWSGMRKYLEQEMLAHSMKGRIRYNCTAYVGMDGDGIFELFLDGETYKQFSWETVQSYFIKEGMLDDKISHPMSITEYWTECWVNVHKIPITDVNYWITPGETYAIEDNPDFLSWRDSSTKAITEGLYKYFNKGSEIKSIKAEQLYQNSHSFYIYYKKEWHYTTKKPKQKYDAYKMTYGNVVLSFSFK